MQLGLLRPNWFHRVRLSEITVRRSIHFYCPYPRRLESLTICKYHVIGTVFSSVILNCQVLVWLEIEARATALESIACDLNIRLMIESFFS